MHERKLGTVAGVHIYKRALGGESSESSLAKNFVNVSRKCGAVDQVFTGLKWECVELARRYLTLVHGLSFEQIHSAIDLWDCPALTCVTSQKTMRWIKVHNGKSEGDDHLNQAPAKGDLIIYPKQKCSLFFEHGHVAVVTEVFLNHILIAEQNVHFAGDRIPPIRTLQMCVENNSCCVKDPLCEVIGWLKASIKD